MTASKPDLKVLAVGWELSSRTARDGYTLVLCEMPDDSAAALPVGCERDWCSPGFVVGVVAALAEAGIGKAGGPGVEMLAQREASWRGIVTRVRNAVGERSIDPTSRVRSAVSRANALAQAVQSISEVVHDVSQECGDTDGGVEHLFIAALDAIEALVESVAADVVAPTQTAREVLAAHGWREGMFPALPGKRPHNWAHASMYGYAWVGDGLISVDASVQPPTVLRAFAQLAEESQP
jgi:hypothetical protein